MTREEVHDMFTRKICDETGAVYAITKSPIPDEAIDAIIDCAVEEAVHEVARQMTEAYDKAMAQCGRSSL